MDSGREQNYWPGFVDALSNVVLTLVFVLVIFVFALVMASNKVEQKMKEITQAEKANKIGQTNHEEENLELKKQLASLTKELEKARADTSNPQPIAPPQPQAVTDVKEEKQIVVDDTQDKKNQGAVQIQSANNTVVLGFPPSIAEMDEKSSEQLGHVLDAVKKTVGSKHKIIMKSIIGKETYSAARRLAYYRAISARNYLITKMGEAPENIIISIVHPPQPEDGRVEIVFQNE